MWLFLKVLFFFWFFQVFHVFVGVKFNFEEQTGTNRNQKVESRTLLINKPHQSRDMRHHTGPGLAQLGLMVPRTLVQPTATHWKVAV